MGGVDVCRYVVHERCRQGPRNTLITWIHELHCVLFKEKSEELLLFNIIIITIIINFIIIIIIIIIII